MLTDQELQRLRNQANECEQAADEIVELRAERDALLASAPRWIACSERMPDDDIDVLAWVADGFFDGRCYIVSRAGDWFVDDDARTVSRVTHWMDLPEAPEEAK
jgi:hypothetical protein